MKVQHYITIVLILVTLSVSAQKDRKERRTMEYDSLWLSKTHHEIGVNVTEFIKTFLVPNNIVIPASATGSYIVTYKTLFKGGPALRFGIGGRYSNRVTEDDDFDGFQSVRNTQLSARIGFEWQFKLGKRWNSYAGVDAIYFSTLNRSDVPNFQQGRFITVDKSRAYGGGPVAGIQFRLHKRISLLTEAAVYGQFSSSAQNQTDTSFPQNNSSTKRKETNVNFVVPQSLFVVITF